MEEKLHIYNELSTIHNQVESRILETVKLGQSAMELRLFIEDAIDLLCAPYRMKYSTVGIAFPVGLNRNHCVAHWSPTAECRQWNIEVDDVIKIDYGIQIDGHIIDGAFTIAFQERHRALLDASRVACMAGARMFKNNRAIFDISSEIYKTIPKSFGVIKTLCGHQIKPYEIHAGNVVPNHPYNVGQRCYAGEVYTVEPFVSTNKLAETWEDTEETDQSHYMFNYREYKPLMDVLMPTLRIIPELPTYGTLAFHRDWLFKGKSNDDVATTKKCLQSFVKKNLYRAYPPVYEKDRNAHVAQFETTVVVTATTPVLCKEYLTVDKYILNGS